MPKAGTNKLGVLGFNSLGAPFIAEEGGTDATLLLSIRLCEGVAEKGAGEEA